jgi:hypothetical protein
MDLLGFWAIGDCLAMGLYLILGVMGIDLTPPLKLDILDK